MIRTAKFDIPANALTEFIDFINMQGLKPRILSKKDDMYKIEIPYTKEQSHIIEGINDLLYVLTTLALASLAALASLSAAAKNNQTKIASQKAAQNTPCFFKDFIKQNVKK
jgi:hypothetical protein